MTLDSGLRRNDVPGIMLCPDIFEHRLLVIISKCHPEPFGVLKINSVRGLKCLVTWF